MATIERGDTKNGAALGVPLNEVALASLLASRATCWSENFRWHDLRHTWASWLRQNNVPTWVLQELGGWKSESMVRRYAHISVKHLQPYADQLTLDPEPSGGR